ANVITITLTIKSLRYIWHSFKVWKFTLAQ
ncbi:unnamed protein product, partial [marine sediment metagenome]